jgi:hypothetical protein
MSRLRSAGYYIGVAVLLAQVIDILLAAFPWRVHAPTWRIAFITSTASVSFTALLTMFILTTIAVVASDRRIAFVLAALSAMIAIGFLGLAGTFALDALQMRNQVRQQMAAQYDYASTWVLARELIAMVGFIVLSIGAFRGARAMRPDEGKVAQQRASNLIVGGLPTRGEKAPPPAGVRGV